MEVAAGALVAAAGRLVWVAAAVAGICEGEAVWREAVGVGPAHAVKVKLTAIITNIRMTNFIFIVYILALFLSFFCVSRARTPLQSAFSP
jgi:hypothetical protein